ncbi:hypothetical protein AJ80_04526 [Polytolypa hystricis UAMH7299]|uniref:SNF2 family helicase/ATPase n=1 Tax=Polytolypa hystricis (strain UAMH7299) TaxID=1447883 RepID=A0A2B7YBQ9_POLH7|nr:hypothetical protein AJ80_04526 [Polytolypa hystricis UAMH7299]
MTPSNPAALLLNPKEFKKQQLAIGTSPFTSTLTPLSSTMEQIPTSPSLATSSSSAASRRASSEPRDISPSSTLSSPSPSSLSPRSCVKDDAYLPSQGRGVGSSPRGGFTPQSGSATTTPPAGTAFNPRQLLNPRTFQAKRPRPPTNTSATLQHKDVSENIGQQPVRLGDSTAGFMTPDAELRHRNLIEDMYGVEERGLQMHKRARLDKEEVDRKNGASRSIATQDGKTGLGGFMKSGSGTSTPTPTVAATIDLTLEDDEQKAEDDVIVVGDRDLGAEQVCYGRLEGATVHAHHVPRPPKSAWTASPSDWPSIKCKLVREPRQDLRIEVLDSAGLVFGILDSRVSAALAPILDATGLDLRAQARLDFRRRKPDEWPAQPCSEVYRISINLYGPRKFADKIGQHIGQKNVWLGTPNAVEAGFSTYNPHAERRLVQAATANNNRFSVQSETRTVEDINSAVTKMFDQLKSAENLPEMEPPSSVRTALLKHQKQALWFMTEKEKPRRFGPNDEDNTSLWRTIYQPNGRKMYRDLISGTCVWDEPPQVLGGLLADMMGLGKTLSILSLVVSSLPQAREWAAMGIGSGNTKTTLLVSPLSAVNNWSSQIKEHLEENAISYYVFHGPMRTTDPKELAQYDLVITTYSTILSEISGKSTKRGVSPLPQTRFFRIVLDEAHAIREQSAAQSQAIFSLEAQRRWSVTGTPIQNRLEDLASVTKFLKLFPYDEKAKFSGYIVSPFKCENPNAIRSLRVLVDSFTLRRVKDRINLPAREDKIITLTFSEQEKILHDFFRKESNVMMNVIAGGRKDKMQGKMYHLVLKAMMVLRQISAHGKELLDKQDRERFRGLSASDAIDLEETEAASSDLAERKAYEMLALMKETSGDNCARCGNSIMTASPEDSPSDNNSKDSVIAGMLPCFDVFCADCFAPIKQAIDQSAGMGTQLTCVFCKGIIQTTYSLLTTFGFEKYQASQLASKQNRKQAKAFGQYEGPHTKTKALISHLLATAEEDQCNPNERPMKSVVFSSWTSHLDLIEIALGDNRMGNSYTRLDGTMTLRQRNTALETFRDDNNITILLATLGAGGVGLNLTSASNVYIMEPQYNPAAVAQAIDRIHRIGQTREVTTIQFIMKDSIEEKIAELANKKQKMADMSLGKSKGDKRELQQEKMKEYRNLFT